MTLYIMLIKWQRNLCRTDSQATVDMSLQNSWTIKINSVWSWFTIHIDYLKVFMSETWYQDKTIHRLSFANWWSNRKSESECEMISTKLLLIHARWLIHLIIYDWIHQQQCYFIVNWQSHQIK